VWTYSLRVRNQVEKCKHADTINIPVQSQKKTATIVISSSSCCSRRQGLGPCTQVQQAWMDLLDQAVDEDTFRHAAVHAADAAVMEVCLQQQQLPLLHWLAAQLATACSHV
jgi:hypothetical protein